MLKLCSARQEPCHWALVSAKLALTSKCKYNTVWQLESYTGFHTVLGVYKLHVQGFVRMKYFVSSVGGARDPDKW